MLDRFTGKEIWIIGDDESIHDERAGVYGTCEGVEDGFLLLRLEGHDEPTVCYNLRYIRAIEIAHDHGPGDSRRFTLIQLDKESDDE